MIDDIFRNLPLRFLGYSFAVGEAIMYVADSSIVDVCYTIGSGYIIVHIASTLIRPVFPNPLGYFCYTVLWEAFASAILPTLFVYHACRLTYRLVYDKAMPSLVIFWSPTMVGLLLIPFIIRPLDDFVDTVLAKAFS